MLVLAKDFERKGRKVERQVSQWKRERNFVQAARKPNSVLDDHSSRRGVTDALDSNLPAGFDRLTTCEGSLRLTATGRCVISPEEER